MEKITSYDPNKKYSWTPEDTFTLSGSEFGLLLNALRAVLNTREASTILLANQANNIVEATLAKAVEEGVVKEAPEEPQQ
ncbi:MAG: hypothetical protein EB127_01300 [Alphaproteobacteria bacterium]|nr:hypothetical protein [Alphaproteobacteria bacterium]